ncbi:MAG: hypothetical protein QXE06_07960 [Candidatus Bathyarchaeia archaeon]
MTNTKRILAKLNSFATVLRLPEKDKRKIYSILNKIAVESKGKDARPQDLISRSEGKYSNYKVRESKINGVGSLYILAALSWLEKRGLLRRKRLPKKGRHVKLILTKKGRSALLTLDGLLNPPQVEPLKIGLVDKGSIKVTFEKRLDAIEKVEFLLNTKVYDAIADVVSTAVDWSLSGLSKINIELDLKYSPVIRLIYYMTRVYRKYTEEYSFPLRDRIIDEIRKSGWEIVNLKQEKLWHIIWTFYEKDAINEINNGKSLSLEKYLPREIIDFETKKWVTLQDYFGDAEVRNFISNVLMSNPNFFMPYFFWEKIGFTVVNPPEEGIVTPPLIHYYFAQNDFPYILVSLRRVLDEATWTLREEGIKFETEDARKQYQQLFKHEKIYRIYDQLHSWFHPSSWLPLIEVDRMKEFYQAWSVLRQKYINILIDISSILDAAYEQYIINNHKPTVDLVKVFSDLAHKIYSESEVLKMISEGKYLLPPEGTARPYNPL